MVALNYSANIGQLILIMQIGFVFFFFDRKEIISAGVIFGKEWLITG
jgi:hypothetical protein